MAITTSYPGVYVDESISLGFSIYASTTAVPVFIFSFDEIGAPEEIFYKFNSWQEVKSVIPEENNDKNFYLALRLWFSLAGGTCYLVEYRSLSEILKLDNVTLIVSNGANNSVIPEIFKLCGPGKNRIALLDGPLARILSDDDPDTVMKDYPVTPYAAVCYPWVKTDWAKVLIPPSVVAAIAIARSDRTRGVWKAPANQVINGITPAFPVSDDLQGRFSQGKALNMIRHFPGSGTMLWGARTLEDSDNWRYIPVRRLFNMVEHDIQQALRSVVFEANSQPIWQKVKATIDNYLYRLWQQGALAGSVPEEAWFVQVGKDITMSDDDIKQGKMIIKTGLAAVRPAEFIILQFSQNIN